MLHEGFNASGINNPLRPTWAEINISSLRYNYASIKRTIPDGVGIMAMVKADAYGHGAIPVAHALEALRVDAFGVATIEEGIELRDAGIDSKILVMGGLMGAGESASARMLKGKLTPVVHSREVLRLLEKVASNLGMDIDAHLKVDTGMNRLGVRPESLDDVLDAWKDCRHVRLEGVMTHLAEAGNKNVSDRQVELFQECASRIGLSMGDVDIWHVANGEASFEGKYVDFGGRGKRWVRPGLALYGICDGIDPSDDRLKPLMRIVSRIVMIKHIPIGARVSYGGDFVAERPSRIGVIPMGYADGYPWRSAGKAKVLIGDDRVPIVGRITMDMMMVDLTDAPSVSVNDEVVLLGRQGGGFISAQEFASWADTIPYEVLCGVSKRMPRIYKE